MADVEKSIKVIAFTNKSDWKVWSMKFLARAYQKGYKSVLLGTTTVPKGDEVLDPKIPDENIKMKARKANDMAYSDLTLCFDDIVNIVLIDQAKTADLPEGDANKAWKNLINKHAPKTTASKVAIKTAFLQSKLVNVKTDPDVWIANLERMKAELTVMKDTMTDEDLIIHVLVNLTKEYEIESTLLKRDLDNDPTKVTIEYVKDRLREKYSSLKTELKFSDDNNNGKGEESALFANKQFKGKCSNCGMWGHKGSDCRRKEGSNNNTSTSNNNNNNNGQFTKKPRFNGNCRYCNKFGHKEQDCFTKKNNKSKSESANVSNENKSTKSEVILTATEYCLSVSNNNDNNDNIWVGDSGASSHMVNSLNGVSNIVDIDTQIKIGDSNFLSAPKKGHYSGTIIQVDGSTTTVKLDVIYVPSLYTNLFSITSALSKGAKLSNDNEVIILNIHNNKVKFDRKLQTSGGHTMGIQINPMTNVENANLTTNSKKKLININEMHQLLGHPSEDTTKLMCKHLNLKVTGTLETCEHCKLGKAQKTKMNKETTNKCNVPLERVYVDIAPVLRTSLGGKRFWLLIVDEATKYKWSYFLKHKSDTAHSIYTFLSKMNEENHPVQCIRCDNAGENVSMMNHVKSNGFNNIKFEFTAPGTPQQNGVVERAFPTLFGRVRAMMNQAGFTKEMRGYMWAECANTATLLDNNMPHNNETTPSLMLYNKQSTWVNNLKVFGEIAVIKNIQTMVGKLENKEKTVMFIGYSDLHPTNTFKFYNLTTRKVSISRDISWLNKTWGEYKNITASNLISVPSSDDDFDDYIDDAIEENDDSLEQEGIITDTIDQEGNIEPIVITRSSTKLDRELKRLNTYYNPYNPNVNVEDAFNHVSYNVDNVEQDFSTFNFELIKEPYGYESFCFSEAETAFICATNSDFNEPANFKEAWYNNNPDTQKKWKEAITKEYGDMITKCVWSYVDIASIETSRKLIGSKWVFKTKKNGIHRARLVALGYNQIPGVDYTENFAPVINDATLRIILVLYLIMKYDSEIIDVETAFLYGSLEEEIYMKVPEGLLEALKVLKIAAPPANSCLKLMKSIYGLVQAARQWWKTFVGFLTKKLGFTNSIIDPCLLFKRENNEDVFICLYVDDLLIVGNTNAIETAINDISKYFSIKRMGKMKEYVGCQIDPSDEHKILLSQPDLIDKMNRIFGPNIKNLSTYKTPGPPGEVVVRPKPDEKLISESLQKDYRSGVGMLLYLIKHSRPDISNAVRELAKNMDGATAASLKSLYRTIKYVVDSKQKVLCLFPKLWNKNELIIEGICDSDYAGDKDKRTSTTGYLVYVNGALITWKSRGQKGVTLSSTEAEYVALSELCTEIIFIKMIIESMHLDVKLPIKIRIDNVGAMFLAENTTTGQRTKHIDVRHHFVKELMQDGTIILEFVRSCDNDADIYTKNVGGDLYDKHSNKYMVLKAM